MILRLLQIFAPERDREAVARLLEEADVVDFWTHDLDDHRFLTEALVGADRAEGITDSLRERFLAHEGFRMVLLAVEATMPRVAEPEKKKKEDGGAEAEDRKAGPPGRLSREELYADVQKGAVIDRVCSLHVLGAGG